MGKICMLPVGLGVLDWEAAWAFEASKCALSRSARTCCRAKARAWVESFLEWTGREEDVFDTVDAFVEFEALDVCEVVVEVALEETLRLMSSRDALMEVCQWLGGTGGVKASGLLLFDENMFLKERDFDLRNLVGSGAVGVIGVAVKGVRAGSLNVRRGLARGASGNARGELGICCGGNRGLPSAIPIVASDDVCDACEV